MNTKIGLEWRYSKQKETHFPSLLGHSLSSFLGKNPLFSLGFGLWFRSHDAATPLLPVFIILVVEVCLHKQTYQLQMPSKHRRISSFRPRSWDNQQTYRNKTSKSAYYLNSLQYFAELQFVFIFYGGQTQNGCSFLMNNLPKENINMSASQPYFKDRNSMKGMPASLPFPSVPFPSRCSMEFPSSCIMLEARQPTLLGQRHVQWLPTVPCSAKCMFQLCVNCNRTPRSMGE